MRESLWWVGEGMRVGRGGRRDWTAVGDGLRRWDDGCLHQETLYEIVDEVVVGEV